MSIIHTDILTLGGRFFWAPNFCLLVITINYCIFLNYSFLRKIMEESPITSSYKLFTCYNEIISITLTDISIRRKLRLQICLFMKDILIWDSDANWACISIVRAAMSPGIKSNTYTKISKQLKMRKGIWKFQVLPADAYLTNA